MRTFAALLASIFILYSCNQTNGEAEYALKKMHDEVMEIHDAVMPRMTEIGKLKRQLKGKLNSDEASLKQDSVQQFIYQLEEADNAMMTWMGDFKKPSYKDPIAAEQVYTAEKQKIIVVQDKMNSTISKVELFLSRI